MQLGVSEPETYIEARMKQFKLVDMRQQYPDRSDYYCPDQT